MIVTKTTTFGQKIEDIANRYFNNKVKRPLLIDFENLKLTKRKKAKAKAKAKERSSCGN
jgi:hypothetical protein